eukprot:Gb_40833 [translate_table: standard]
MGHNQRNPATKKTLRRATLRATLEETADDKHEERMAVVETLAGDSNSSMNVVRGHIELPEVEATYVEQRLHAERKRRCRTRTQISPEEQTRNIERQWRSE